MIPEKFQHILRVLNTNIDGRRKIAFAITAIKVRVAERLPTANRTMWKCEGFCNKLREISHVSDPLQGVGRRYAHVVLRKADIDLNKRAGELTEDEVRFGAL